MVKLSCWCIMCVMMLDEIILVCLVRNMMSCEQCKSHSLGVKK